MKVERKRKPHRCSVKPDPQAGWAVPLEQWRREFEALYATRRPVRKG